MDIISKIVGNTLGNTIKSIGETVDRFVTTKEEQEKLKMAVTDQLNKFKETILTVTTNFVSKQEEELTKRLQSDMGSDSWLSKNIRPMSLIYILSAFTFFSISPKLIGLEIDKGYVTLLGDWGEAIMKFYFTGRSIEKIVDIASGVWKK